MNSDFKDLLQSLHEHEVMYLVVGGYAVIHHSQPRYTKDIDIWVCPSSENAGKLMRAFRHFGIPLIDLTEEDFATPRTQFSIGARRAKSIFSPPFRAWFSLMPGNRE